MENLNITFFEEYKRLNKLCEDIYNDNNGITHYINDMKSVSQINYRYDPNWKSDLNQLIKLRHIINHLAHTEGAFKEIICEQNDIDWLNNFYERILNQSDPMAIFYQNSKVSCEKENHSDNYSDISQSQNVNQSFSQWNENRSSSDIIKGCFAVVIILFIIILISVVIVLFYV